MKLKTIIITLISILVITLPACISVEQIYYGKSPAPAYKVVTVHEQFLETKMPVIDDPLLVNPSDEQIHLYGCGSQTVAFQIILPNPKSNRQLLQIEKLHCQNGKDKNLNLKFSVYKLLKVEVKPDEFDAFAVRSSKSTINNNPSLPYIYDAMLELSADESGQIAIPRTSQDIATNSPTILWLEVTLPEGLSRGNFYSKITLLEGRRSFSRNLILRSWGFDLPKTNINIIGKLNIPEIWQESDLGTLSSADYLSLPPDQSRTDHLAHKVGQYAKLLSEHGIEVWPTNVYPKLEVTLDDQIQIDWLGYKKLLFAVLENSSQPQRYWPVPLDLKFPSTRIFGPFDSPLYQRISNKIVQDFNQQFIDTNQIEKTVSAAVWPENYEQELLDYPAANSLMKFWSTSIPNLSIINPFIPSDLRPLGFSNFKPFTEASKSANIFCPQERWLDPAMISTWKKQNKKVFIRLSDSSGSLPKLNKIYPRFLPRSLPWLINAYELDGVVISAISNTSDTLIYPGKQFDKDAPLCSVRLKIIKQGIDDVRYMLALKQANRNDSADWLTRHLIRFAFVDAADGSLWTIRNDGLCNSDRAWYLPGIIAGFEIYAQKHQQAKLTDSQNFEIKIIDDDDLLRKLAIGQFRESTAGVAFESEGVRFKNVLDVETGQEKIELTYHVVTRNFKQGLTEGEIKLDSSADAPQINHKPIKLDGLDWSWPVRTAIKSNNKMMTRTAGVDHQSMILTMSDHSQYQLDARICSLIAGSLQSPITIDGDFTDWPENNSAVAGDFKKIEPDGLNSNRAYKLNPFTKFPTTVQMGFNKQNLYLAFTCYQPKETLISKSTNTIKSSSTLPWGEDLVAIAINPDNSASLDPRDTYQIIVKANGNVLTCRGTVDIRKHRACDLWPNHTRASVAIFEDRWQVEVAIPFEDLNPQQKTASWWGVDFARFAAYQNEFSTWSGAKNQYAKPISMGNVLISNTANQK